jgi:hypothetical protein
VLISYFLCKILAVTKVVTYMDVQITQLFTHFYPFIFFAFIFILYIS